MRIGLIMEAFDPAGGPANGAGSRSAPMAASSPWAGPADPTEQELAAAEVSMRAQGVAGWLAVMEGNPYTTPAPTLLEVRTLASPTGSFGEAVAAFHARRA